MKRLTLLGAVLAVALLAVWLLALRPERIETGPSATEPEAQVGRGPAELTLPARVDEAATTATRELATSPRTESEPQPKPPQVAQVDEAESAALLLVRAVDQRSGDSLPSVRVSVRLQHARSSSSRHVQGSRGSLDASPLTDAAGRAELEVPAGVELRLTARGADENVGRVEVEVEPLARGERRELVLEVPTGNDLHFFVRVLAHEDRAPIAGAQVELLRASTRTTSVDGKETSRAVLETIVVEGLTDEEGRFDAWLRSWSVRDLRVRAPGYGLVLGQVGKEHDAPELAKVVLLSSAATLRARVQPDRGGPLPDGSVRLWTEGHRLTGSESRETYYYPSISWQEWRGPLNAEGTCTLAELPAGVPLHVEILRAGEVVKKDLPDLVLEPGEQREVEWSLGSGCRLAGTLVDEHDAPVAGHAVWLQRAAHDVPCVFSKYSARSVAESTTDEAGRFAFDDVGPGRWCIGPAAVRSEWEGRDPQALAPVALVVEIPEGSPTEQVLLRAHRGLYIEGRVLDPAGEPARGVSISGFNMEAGVSFHVPDTEEDGSFALGPLVPGRYGLWARGGGGASPDRLVAEAGARDIVLVMKAGGTLKGTVRDGARGEETPARLLLGRCGDPDPSWWANHARDGAFRFDGLEPGTYCLAARASGGRTAIVRDVVVVAGGSSEVELTLVPGATLRVKYAGKSGELMYELFSGDVRVAAESVAAGTTSETAVPIGRLRLECDWFSADPDPNEDAYATRELVAGVGETLEVVLGEGH
ncbi:MAG TPA: carboxypeptidase-like regulatory domain-containing protein [Planctomycetota bacterium]